MKLQEFRIGNYYIDNRGIISAIDHEFYANIFKGVDIDLLIKEPITINEDWITKLGFIYDEINNGESTLYYINGIRFFIDYASFQPVDYDNINIVNYEIKYVHEIQNIFHCITGTELKLNNHE